MTEAEKYLFVLYVAGKSPHGQNSLTHLHRFCDRHLSGLYEIEVVDILENPKKAVEEGILVTPTVVRARPYPVERLIGALSDEEKFKFLLASHDGEG